MKILFKLTTRSRPQLAIRAIESIFSNITARCYVDLNFLIYVTLDSDENENEKENNMIIRNKYKFRFNHVVQPRTAKETGTKISAINRDLEDIKELEWDVLVNVSDDQVFIKKAFDEEILNAFGTNLDQFIHFPDGNQKDLSTMSIIGRDYFNRDGYIYNPEYVSVYCDNEAQDVAKLRGCYKFVDIEIAHHLHPAWGKGGNDEQYKKTEHPIVYEQDRQTYERRMRNNFFIN